MLDIRLFQQFVAVAEEASFRKAAQRLHISQPPLSVAIQKLEQIVGAALFERTRRYVKLTPAGAAFLPEARRAIEQARLAVGAARHAVEGRTGTLRLSFIPTAGLDIMPLLIREFRASFPTVNLIISSDSSMGQVEALRRGETDGAVLVLPPEEIKHFTVQVLSRDQLVLAVPAEHALAGRAHVRLRELAAEAFFAFALSKGPGYAGTIIAACQDAGFFPRIAQEAGEMQSLLALVAGGGGIALVPSSMRRIAMDDVSFVTVTHRSQPLGYPVVLVTPLKSTNPALASLLTVAQRVSSRGNASGAVRRTSRGSARR
ncbi:MAG: LysR family transcriptional regulator [Burkholderiaceae bacterium]